MPDTFEATAVVVYQEPTRLDLVEQNTNYLASLPSGKAVELVRDVDFGKLPKVKQPTLYQPGAEKVIWAYELLERYTLESAEENHEDAYFFYRFRCDLVKLLPNGNEVVVKSGWGSANSKESRNGSAGGWNSANATLKMAKKRAMVAAAISIGRLSGMFTQDIENETFMDKAGASIEADSPDSFISAAQVKRIFAIGGTHALTTEKIKTFLAAEGWTKVKEIRQKDYNAVCDKLEAFGKNGGVK